MPLILRPNIKDFSREELEAHFEAIRARRMAIAFDYQIGLLHGFENSRNKNERRYGISIEKLGRELVTLDRALEKVETRMRELIQIKQEDETLSSIIDSTRIQSEG